MTRAEGLRLTLPHWYGFTREMTVSGAAVLTVDEWDRLRESDAAFGFGRSRDDWMNNARSNVPMVRRAQAVAGLLRSWQSRAIVSAGVGTGMFEFLLKSELPQLVMRCGDWSPDSLRILGERFTESDTIELMDLRQPSWARNPDEVLLLNRVDMELTDAEWRAFFTQVGKAGVRRAIWIPCGLLDAGALVSEVRGVLAGIGKRRQLARSGFLRTRARMLELFANLYERREVLHEGDLPTWGLHMRGGDLQ